MVGTDRYGGPAGRGGWAAGATVAAAARPSKPGATAVKIGLMFASSAYTTAEECAAVAEVAEEVGLESLWAVEHVFVPQVIRTPYPYTADGELAGVADAVLCDPVVWLSFMAGITRTLRLATGIMILPQRNPAYVAKEWATLDRLSGGRAILGVGIGWLTEEMEALGIPFSERGPRTDEAIEAVRSLWAPGASTVQGRFHRWEDMVCNPKPAQAGGVPIVVGGHAPAAARRAARLGDGFFWPANLSGRITVPGEDPAADPFAKALAALRDECSKLGRDPAEIELTTGGYQLDAAALDELEAAGIARVVVPSPPIAKLRARLEPLGELLRSR